MPVADPDGIIEIKSKFSEILIKISWFVTIFVLLKCRYSESLISAGDP